MNHIEKVRAEIQEYFDPQKLVEDSFETTFSPDKSFRMRTSRYRQNKPELNWYVTNVEVFDNHADDKLFNFLANDAFFHAWFAVGGLHLLVGAEDMYGGQTVIDLTNRRMASYSPGEDGFIWTEFFLSPDGRTLATIGCVWAGPYEIRIYDFSEPMNLPLKELRSVVLIGNETVTCWLDDMSLQTKGTDEEYIEEHLDDGTIAFKVTGVKVIDRVISISS